MLALDTRCTLLAVVCCLSTFGILPSISVNAAVVSRHSGSSLRSSTNGGPVNDATLHSQQRVLPWSSRSLEGSSSLTSPLSSGSKSVHKVRTTNPVQRFADALISRFKHKGGHRKRSHKTIIIPTDHGNSYLLSHARRSPPTPLWMAGQHNETNGSNTTSSIQSEDSGAPGVVRIQSQSGNSTQGRKTLGSLYLTNSTGVYTLNASGNNETRLFMVNAPPSTTRNALDSSSSDNSAVYLIIPRLQDSNDYCATYNDSPNKPEPITMQPCNNYTAPDGSSTSQTFMFNPKSNELRPTWVDGTNTTAQAASISNSTTTTDTASGTQPTPTGITSRDDSTAINTQNVTLIWEAASNMTAAGVNEALEDSPDSTSSTVTTTRTVTVFQTGSSSSTLTSTSGTPSATGLNVEVVGNTPYSSSSPSASSMSMMDISSSSSSSVVPSSSVDAAAIAASVASSASASMSSASASSQPATASAADISPSASATSTSGSSSSTFVAAVKQRSPWIKAEAR